MLTIVFGKSVSELETLYAFGNRKIPCLKRFRREVFGSVRDSRLYYSYNYFVVRSFRSSLCVTHSAIRTMFLFPCERCVRKFEAITVSPQRDPESRRAA